ncbi:hypothetical protein Hanom_Chr02g00148661 [Helianthus anomalus]
MNPGICQGKIYNILRASTMRSYKNASTSPLARLCPSVRAQKHPKNIPKTCIGGAVLV